MMEKAEVAPGLAIKGVVSLAIRGCFYVWPMAKNQNDLDQSAATGHCACVLTFISELQYFSCFIQSIQKLGSSHG